MAGMEIERKFLVLSDDFIRESYNCTHIIQGYICASGGRTVRVRVRDEKAYLTIKGPSDADGLGRFEWEKEISLDDARSLLELAQGGFIDKERYLVRNADGVHTWEVDVFHGANEGLVVAEVELSSASDTFCRPSWLGAEVTSDPSYRNSALLLHPFCDWPKH